MTTSPAHAPRPEHSVFNGSFISFEYGYIEKDAHYAW